MAARAYELDQFDAGRSFSNCDDRNRPVLDRITATFEPKLATTVDEMTHWLIDELDLRFHVRGWQVVYFKTSYSGLGAYSSSLVDAASRLLPDPLSE